MARIDDLISQIPDRVLRGRLESALADMKRRQRFGLVFEDHVPESAVIANFRIQVGEMVLKRREADIDRTYVVRTLDKRGRATIQPTVGGDIEAIATKELLATKRFGEPIFPALTSLGRLCRGGDKPHHAVINGENFHTLQLLSYLYEGKVDCIYIDPPYNTGAKDWKYNNRYVDKKDVWRHSKWLSMMEKRLRISERLLKPDGVLICTIDEHEVNHLGMLLEKVFKKHLHYMVTIVINPKGREKANFAPVEEYAFFVVPDTGDDRIFRSETQFLGGPELADDEDQSDEEIETTDEEEFADEIPAQKDPRWEIRHARRRGGGAESSSYREKRPNQFYPIYIDETARRVVRAGKAIPADARPDFRKVKGLRPIWPIDTQGRHRVWAFVPTSMQKLIDEGNVLLGRYHTKRDDWTINYRVVKKETRKLKTVWWEKAHDAGTHGTELIKKLLGQPGLFPFPKSVYAVRDCLAAVVKDRPDALILDFFAGSGTTLHATCLLNSQDGGSRRSILVTNNEVDEGTSKKLNQSGIFRGDAAYEKMGIFAQATKPRCEAVISGKQPDGQPVPGKHIGGGLLSEGFPENVEFFSLDYLDPDEIDLGLQFEAIFPSLWLAAGGVGQRPTVTNELDMVLAEGQPYGVLLQEEAFRRFARLVLARNDITHIWIVTDSEDAFSEMRAALPARIKTSMLYRDYLRNFRINTRNSI